MQEQQPKKEKPKLYILDAVQCPYGVISKYQVTYYNNKFEFYVNPNIMEENDPDEASHAGKYIDLLTVSRLPGFRKQYEANNTTFEREFSRGKQLFLSELNNKMPRSELRDHTLYPLILQSVLKDLFFIYKKSKGIIPSSARPTSSWYIITRKVNHVRLTYQLLLNAYEQYLLLLQISSSSIFAHENM